MLDSLINKAKCKCDNPVEKELKSYIPMVYTNKYSELVGNIFKKAKYTLGYKINNPMIKNRVREPQNKESTKGVYIVRCDENVGCDKSYIGYTNRSLQERFKEHNARSQKNPSSKVAQHLKAHPDHNIEFDKSMQTSVLTKL